MRRRFEFEVRAEYQQFLLYDLAANTVENHDWTCEAEERLLAVEEGIIGVGTISDGIVSVVLEIADSEPNEDMSRWDQVNEATIEVPSGIASLSPGSLITCGMLERLIWNQVHTERGCITGIWVR